MKTYHAYFEHHHGFSEDTIEAADIDEALTKARSFTEADYAFIHEFEIDPAVRFIGITEESSQTKREWAAPDYAIEKAAPHLASALVDMVSWLMDSEEGDADRASRNRPLVVLKARDALIRAGIHTPPTP